MSTAGELRSGKGHRDENFPVASRLVDARHRGIILAFYEFVRVADDIADHATLSVDEKLAQLDRLEANLLGQGVDNAEAVRLRAALAERALPPRHAQDLLVAFRMDVTKLRYRDWDDLIHYCSTRPCRSAARARRMARAAPLGRRTTRARRCRSSTTQDCAKDFRDLNRVYIPLDCVRRGRAAGAARRRAAPQLPAASMTRGAMTAARRARRSPA